ncbi:hypothetical protein BCY84_18181 [Trypanosoma cruzi cruzi]|nr:hypothetical protein BCY84_18181 [Trypanosoma cruzi cruzi]
MLRMCEAYQVNITLPQPPELFDSFLRVLEEHHLVTSFLVEAISDWREPLSRPFPFVVSGENYLYRIMDDCSLLDASLLGSLIGLRLTEYPLGSRNDRVAESKRKRGVFVRGVGGLMCVEGEETPVVMQGWPSLWRRKKVQRWIHEIDATSKRRCPLGRKFKCSPADLQRGEAVIKGEGILQRNLMDELSMKAEQGLFVTLLATPDIVRGASDGLPLLEGCSALWCERAVGGKFIHRHCSDNNNNNKDNDNK